MKPSIYQYSDPYPTIQGLAPNRRSARLLLSAYGGGCSELTAITQYIFHHLEAAELPGLSACLRGIAIVEMHHLDLLGGCIRRLGLRPKYVGIQNGRALYWNASFVKYGKDLKAMIEADIQGEYGAIRHYEKIIRQVEEPQIRLLLQRIVLDEKLHIHHLEQALRQL